MTNPSDSNCAGCRPDSIMLGVALDHARRGTPVFPCRPIDRNHANPKKAKKAKTPLTPNGFKDATCHAPAIMAWWHPQGDHPDALIGVPQGKASGMFTVDLEGLGKPGIEPGFDGLTSWRALVEKHGPVPETLTATTPSGGLHVRFKHVDGVRDLPLHRLGPGIEIKAEGGYVIVPPSTLRNGGGAYRYNGCHEVAEAPGWLIDLIKREGERQKAERFNPDEPGHPENIKRLRAALDVIPSDDRHVWFQVCCALVNVGRYSPDLDCFALFDEWSKKSDKYDAREVHAKWHRDLALRNYDYSVASIYWLADQFEPGWRRVEIEAKLDEFVAYRPQHNYIFTPTREHWPAASVNAHVGPVPCGEESISASHWLDTYKAVEQMTWAPGEPMLIHDKLVADAGWIERPDSTLFNLYRPPTLVPQPGNVDKWREHVVRLYGEEGAQHVERFLGHRIQRPHEKINHALVLGGLQGIGKDTILEPVKRAVGSWNFKEVSPGQLLDRWNDFLKSVILRVNEAHDLGEYDRYNLYDRLKAIEAAPPDTLRIDEKYYRQYYVFNVTAVIITTNHQTDGLYLPADDRRHYVLWSDAVKEDFEEGYWNAIWQWYEGGGVTQIAHYLANLDLSDFNPKAPPKKTEAFWNIVNANRAPESEEMADVLEKMGWPPAVTVGMVCQQCGGSSFSTWLEDRKNGRLIPHRFEDQGYVRISNPDATDKYWRIGGARRVVYAKRDLSEKDRITAARNLVDGGTPTLPLSAPGHPNHPGQRDYRDEEPWVMSPDGDGSSGSGR